ncbi:MAG: DUF559 domain-containing protein [Chloroflexi bacterium]|nr:DUF559 domain-containing protein [Chloroflexota bacterium]
MRAKVLASQGAARARRLRKNSTEAERILRRHLHSRQFVGCKFRRQAPRGKYIVDFLRYEGILAIEIDGGQRQLRKEEDSVRTDWPEAQGFRVGRIWIKQVLTQTEAVLDATLREWQVQESPSP